MKIKFSVTKGRGKHLCGNIQSVVGRKEFREKGWRIIDRPRYRLDKVNQVDIVTVQVVPQEARAYVLGFIRQKPEFIRELND